MKYIEYVTKMLRSVLQEDDPKEIPKSNLDKEKEAERQNALKSNVKNIQIGTVFVSITTHAASQAVVRRSDLEPKDWEIIFKRCINDIKNRGNGYYLYYSKSYEQGIIVFWNHSTIAVITILPKGRANPKPGTDKIIIEKIEYDFYAWCGINLNEENIIEIE